MLDILSRRDPIPKYYTKLFASTDKVIAHSRNFLDGLHGLEETSKENYKSVPCNATIRSVSNVENLSVFVVHMVLTTMPIGKMKLGN